MTEVITMLIPIVAILSCVALPIGLGMYMGIVSGRAKHKENMELIKQGIVPPPEKKSTPNKYRSLRNGFLCIGIGLGLFGGMFGLRLDLNNDQDFFILAGMVLLFLGIAYTLFYFVTRNKDLEEQ